MTQEIEPNPVTDARSGASVDNPFAPFPVEPYDAKALPMTVWLRGDEPYCDEFVLDADAVMAQLGIKRSRLTQISGKELRVGRMRMGRYIRPVYRQRDVLAYKEWVRPTSSHRKSSHLINEAAEELAHQAEELAQLAQQSDLKRSFGAQTQLVREQLARQLDRLRADLLQASSLHASGVKSQLEERFTALAESLIALSEGLAALEQTPQWAEELAKDGQLWREGVAKRLSQQQKLLKSIEHRLLGLQDDVCELLWQPAEYKPRRLAQKTRRRVLAGMARRAMLKTRSLNKEPRPPRPKPRPSKVAKRHGNR